MKSIEMLKTRIDHLENVGPEAATEQIMDEIRHTIDAAISESGDTRSDMRISQRGSRREQP